MYVCNSIKSALLITGNTDPTFDELDAAVTATGYSGFVSLEYHLMKQGGSSEPEPDPDPDPDPDPEAIKKSKPRR